MIKVGILGYGNLGRGVEAAIKKNDDMELVAVYTRRDPSTLTIKTPTAAVKSTADLDTGKEELDILVICGGSATDLPEMTPKYAAMYNVIDSFDTHARVPEHFANVDKAAKSAGKVGIISCGWDPGMFSLNRVYAGAVLPDGQAYTFWGIPVPEALVRVRSGENPELTTREKHLRECFVVAEEGADLARIENEIKTMPNYFADYDTTVHFIDAEEMKANHSGLPHGGSVIYSGTTSDGTKHVIEYSLNLDSNPEFTGSVLVAFARAAVRLNAEGASGAKTVFDIAPAYLCRESGEELRAHLL